MTSAAFRTKGPLRIRLSIAVTVIEIAFCVFPAEGQIPQSSLATTARLVTVDVTLQDHDHHFVSELRCNDFHLTEDNVPQQLDRCEEHRATHPALQPGVVTGVNTFTNTPSRKVGALEYNVVLLDYAHSPEIHPGKLTDVAQTLLSHPNPDHAIALFTLGEKLKLISGFTDHEAAWQFIRKRDMGQTVGVLAGAALSSDDPSGANSGAFVSTYPGLPSSHDTGPYAATIRDSAAQLSQVASIETTIGAFQALDAWLAPLPGRKNILWVTGSSPGLFQSGALMGQVDEYSDELYDLQQNLARHRIAISTLDAHGVTNDVLTPAEEHGPVAYGAHTNREASIDRRLDMARERRTSLDKVAWETGGRSYHGNDLLRELREALDAGSDYYTLSYLPSTSQVSSSFRRFHITVSKPGVQLAYREGYYPDRPSSVSEPAKSSLDPRQPQPEPSEEAKRLYAAVQRGIPTSDEILFGVHITTLPVSAGRSGKDKDSFLNLKLDYLVAAADLKWTEVAGRHTAQLRMMLLAYDGEDKIVASEDHITNVTRTHDQWVKLHDAAVPMSQTVFVPAKKPIFLRLAVLDTASRQLGTLEIPTATIRPLNDSAPEQQGHR